MSPEQSEAKPFNPVRFLLSLHAEAMKKKQTRHQRVEFPTPPTDEQLELWRWAFSWTAEALELSYEHWGIMLTSKDAEGLILTVGYNEDVRKLMIDTCKEIR